MTSNETKTQDRMTSADRAAMLRRLIGLKQEIEDVRYELEETKLDNQWLRRELMAIYDKA
jgi:hypothetical protein